VVFLLDMLVVEPSNETSNCFNPVQSLVHKFLRLKLGVRDDRPEIIYFFHEEIQHLFLLLAVLSVHLLIEVNKEDSAVVADSVIIASQHYFPQSREALQLAYVCHSEAASAHIYLHNTFM
jgi:hypothetical protein